MDLQEARPPGEVVVGRGGIQESVHYVHLAVVDATGSMVAAVGDPGWFTFYRSAAKPLQALPLVEDGVLAHFGIEPAELALCSASHGGEPLHLEVVRGLLSKIGLAEDDLACGSHLPLNGPEGQALLRRGETPGRPHNNCSGKHAGMLALAVFHGWATRGYQQPEHPVQRRMLGEVLRWTGLSEAEVGSGVDGCGVVCFAVPLWRMALSFARFAEEANAHEGASAVVAAMTNHPFMVAGTGRLCTALMEQVERRIFVKTGAEGVYYAGVPARGIGIALKVADGRKRAADAALVHVLGQLELLSSAELAALGRYGRPPVLNTRGEVVGEVLPGFELRRGRR